MPVSERPGEGQRIFVTGGNGFIGSRVVRELCGQGYSVRCLLRESSKTDRIDGLPYERVTGDVLSRKVFELDDCDGVVHLASPSGWRDIRSGGLLQTAVEGTSNVLEAAAKRNLRTVVMSSNAATGGSDSPVPLTEDVQVPIRHPRRFTYAFAKQRVEQLCQEAAAGGLPVMVVRPSEVYGPGDRDMITAGNLVDFARSSPVFVPKGGTGVVHVDDVAAGTVAALQCGRPGERYTLSGDNMTVKQLAELTLRLLGQTKRIVTLPNGLLLAVARVGGTLRLPLPFEPEVMPYAVRYWYADNAKAVRDLDIAFRSAEDTLRPTLDWLVAQGYIKAVS